MAARRQMCIRMHSVFLLCSSDRLSLTVFASLACVRDLAGKRLSERLIAQVIHITAKIERELWRGAQAVLPEPALTVNMRNRNIFNGLLLAGLCS
jgi:hypothetical protein